MESRFKLLQEQMASAAQEMQGLKEDKERAAQK